MKTKITYIIILIASLIYYSCVEKNSINNQKTNHNAAVKKEIALADVKFATKRHDFGELSRDTVVEVLFPFKNISDNNLIVDYVDPDCTCTGYELSKDTIPPGDSATIKITFNTEHKYGQQKIYVITQMNTEIELYKLMFIANVVD